MTDEQAPPPEPPKPPEPLLRTLAPALRGLHTALRRWLDTPHRHQLSALDRATLEGMATDLRRQAEALDVEKPLLVVMLMGGTGVGKSSLLNALAGGAIARAGFTRPTTRDPVVYYHESVKPDRLDPALQHCRLAGHDREALAQKIIVDTPDLDSNDLANREKLQQLLPVADVVLYVGSQEKYHDRLGWELFKKERKRRAFAFVLNKWDRCLHQTVPAGAAGAGLRPDEDLLRDVKEEGFENPRLFRTAAQCWVEASEHGSNGAPPPNLPEGEQFAELRDWLEMGLTRLEIEAIKARGVVQLLEQLQEAMAKAAPPDLSASAERVRAAWERHLGEEASVFAGVLLSTLEPYQSEIEHHFRVEGQQRFRGLFASYLRLVSGVKYAGTTLRDRVPLMPRAKQAVQTPTRWNINAFTGECSRVASERVLDQRGTALVNRLLVEADQYGFPLSLLTGPTTEAAKLDWRQRFSRALREALGEVEQVWAKPTGPRRYLQWLLVALANFLPELAFLAAWLLFLWRFFVPESGMRIELLDLALPFVVLLVVVVTLQVLIGLLLPMRWRAIRDLFQHQLEGRLLDELRGAYGSIPIDVAAALNGERQQVEAMRTEVGQVADWLRQRERAAHIEDLYGG